MVQKYHINSAVFGLSNHQRNPKNGSSTTIVNIDKKCFLSSKSGGL